MRIGVISDTHGLLRPEAAAALQGVEHILHMGDVGDPTILERLRQIAPVTAVRGNVDTHDACALLPDTEVVEFGGVSMYLLHNLADLDLNPKAAGFAAVLYGHTHQPKIETRHGVLYFNPGSAGPKRFQLPVSVGILKVADGKLAAELRTIL
jgi:putative phosphoesterase